MATQQEKGRARAVVALALKLGLLERGSHCAGCGKAGSWLKPLDAHHENYDKPLVVVWLCRACHREVTHIGSRAKSEAERSRPFVAMVLRRRRTQRRMDWAFAARSKT